MAQPTVARQLLAGCYLLIHIVDVRLAAAQPCLCDKLGRQAVDILLFNAPPSLAGLALLPQQHAGFRGGQSFIYGLDR